jgi:hypothetical protein
MKHWIAVCAVFALMLGGLAATAVAEDMQPPPWRGQLGTTSQIWEFMDPDPAPLPDGPAPNGKPPLPSTHAVITPGPGMVWLQIDPVGPREGVWPLSGMMEVTVDNYNPPNDVKLVWVQLTWRPQVAGAQPMFENLQPAPVSPPRLIADIPLGPEWRESVYAWEIRPNPPDERFIISGSDRKSVV